MNSFSVFVLIFAAVLAMVSALPSLSPVQVQGQTLLMKVVDSGSDPTLDDLIMEEDSAEVGDRFRRATCDLLSVSTIWGSLNHSACAAHCLAMRKGYRGGRCKDGVCHCRR